MSPKQMVFGSLIVMEDYAQRLRGRKKAVANSKKPAIYLKRKKGLFV